MTEDNTKGTERPAMEDIAEQAEENDPENEEPVEPAAAPAEETEDSAENRLAEESATQEKAAIEPPSETEAADLNGAGKIEVVEDFDLNLLLDIPLEITVELGRNRVRIQELLELEPGSTVTLSKLEREPVDILANDKLIARGEVVLQNKKYGIRITEITSRMNRIKSLH
ncbi:MAG: flagellar motor switch protein FliN [Desulfobacterales bacterium]|jgi:flagellar motor switch protein FliN/FliY